jgi:sporulation protein YlmC with PRC-barrel domain
MSTQDRGTPTAPMNTGAPGPDLRHGPGPELMGASTLIDNQVRNQDGEELGSIKEIMLDTETGSISYAVLSFGGYFGMGAKLFAVPWAALTLDTERRCFVLNVTKDRLESAPGFDKTKWPNMSDPAWAQQIRSHYGSGAGSDGRRA